MNAKFKTADFIIGAHFQVGGGGAQEGNPIQSRFKKDLLANK